MVHNIILKLHDCMIPAIADVNNVSGNSSYRFSLQHLQCNVMQSYCKASEMEGGSQYMANMLTVQQDPNERMNEDTANCQLYVGYFIYLIYIYLLSPLQIQQGMA